MSREELRRAPPAFAWVAAAIASAFAGVGALIVAGAGSTPVGQITAVLVGFLVLGAASVLAFGLAGPRELRPDRNDDWPW